jgi:hypothetical protein
MKRRFDFRLERVRRVRAIEERVAREERARAEGLARAAEASRDRARAALERSRAELAALLSGALEPRGVLSAQRGLDAELARLRRTVESARTLRTQAERMAAVHRERKAAERALDELRAREKVRHGAAVARADDAELDEAAQRLDEAARSRARNTGHEEGSRAGPPRADHGPGSPPPS